MAVLKVQVETERDGIVTVRAKAAPGREGDARPIAGFFVRRRYEGDTFKINDWTEFSPRWMEFVDPIPEGWEDKIRAREKGYEELMLHVQVENSKTPEQRVAEQMLSMANVMNGATQYINQATGTISDKPRRGRPPKAQA